MAALHAPINEAYVIHRSSDGTDREVVRRGPRPPPGKTVEPPALFDVVAIGSLARSKPAQGRCLPRQAPGSGSEAPSLERIIATWETTGHYPTHNLDHDATWKERYSIFDPFHPVFPLIPAESYAALYEMIHEAVSRRRKTEKEEYEKDRRVPRQPVAALGAGAAAGGAGAGAGAGAHWGGGEGEEGPGSEEGEADGAGRAARLTDADIWGEL
jgi:hypothetical protein